MSMDIIARGMASGKISSQQDIADAGKALVVGQDGVVVPSSISSTDSVKYTQQSLTDAQKSQARTNIAAVAIEEYNSSATSYAEGVLYYVVD